ncbi:MAG: ABC transporter permease [Chitinivibrionales bacterium]
MKLVNIVIREIKYRRVTFLLSAGALGVVLGAVLLSAHMLSRTHAEAKRSSARQIANTERMMKDMVKQYKDITARMANTIRIIPDRQDVVNFHTDGFASHTLTDDVWDELTTRFRKDIRFALPVLRKKVPLDAIRRSVLVSGLGDVFEQGDSYTGQGGIPRPKDGTVSLGYEIHQAMDIRAGDRVKLFNEEFTVESCESQRGSLSDITIWMTQKDAARVVDGADGINEIWVWPSLDMTYEDQPLYQILSKGLSDARIIESQAPALMQIRARMTAAKISRDAIERENAEQSRINRRHTISIIAIGVALLTAALLWVSMLMFQNISAREAEFAIMKTLGYRPAHIAYLVAARSLAAGGLGAVFGTLIAMSGIAAMGHQSIYNVGYIISLFGAGWGAIFVLTMLCTIAPLVNAVNRHPAAVLAIENQ